MDSPPEGAVVCPAPSAAEEGGGDRICFSVSPCLGSQKHLHGGDGRGQRRVFMFTTSFSGSQTPFVLFVPNRHVFNSIITFIILCCSSY